ncbi:MAG: tRNA (adenosine(37)-N6)-dimethylallyltransferase MiaA [Ignavibacteriales bacterium]|nr:tRNA (adenosine(37)-N6)-dimethylallyltransferase MiaA [Ignavibacteriales bacterium]
MKKQRNVLVILGATASGKTPVSLIIAKKINCEIISADSRQIYKMMDIGTAKPTLDELKSVSHHFIDRLLPDQNFNAGEFGKQGRLIIDEIFSKGKIPLVVGGSGLYIRALIDGFFDGPSADSSIREELYRRLEVEGGEILLEELRQIDPTSASRMLPTNTRRIVRALEVFKTTGIPISEMHKSKIDINFHPVFVGLNWNRKKLYDRINKRVELMFQSGLIDEVKQLRAKGYSSTLNALQTVGYKEVFDYLDNRTDYNRMVELIKQNSRRYAKRQLTWFRHDERIKWFDVNCEDDFEKIGLEITKYFIKSFKV